MAATKQSGGRLVELLRLFGWLGIVGVGGPAAHIAMMRRWVVKQRKWESDDDFVRLVGACALVPGPNSTEMAMALGARRSGWRGLLVSGVSFIAPAFGIMCVIGWIYEDVLTRAAIAEIRRWVAPIVAAVVLEALWKLRTTAVRDAKDAMVVVLALVGAVLGVAELLVLLIVGAASIAFRHPRTGVTRDRTGVPGTKMNLSPVFLGAATIVGAATVAVPLWKILVVFLQIGSVIYGSGYVLLVFLESEIVARGWISPEVLLDSISVGQFTPGPVFTTATFIGWHLAGFGGAVAATVGIFGPSFVFASFVERIVSWSQRWRMFASFLRGVSSGSIALIAFVLVRLADDAFIDTFAVGTFVASLAMIVGVPWLWRVRRARLG